MMHITYDPTKNAKNIAERGLDFERVVDFEFSNALVHVDSRKDYRETRYLALGLLKTRLHVLVFTETESGIRVISLRKANKREILRYEQYQKTTN